jgi:type IV secretory pathway VirB2 component (pilin)
MKCFDRASEHLSEVALALLAVGWAPLAAHAQGVGGGADPGSVFTAVTQYMTTGNLATAIATGICLIIAAMLARGHHAIEAFGLMIAAAAIWFKGQWIAANIFGVG